MGEVPVITAAEPISPLWNAIDNRVVTWCNRQVDWMFWWGSSAAQYAGYLTSNQWAFFNVTQKIISTALHAASNYANVHRVQSTFKFDEIKNFLNKENPTPAEDYRLADLLYQRALQYDFGAEILFASPGHYKEETNFLIRFSRFYLNSELCSYLTLRAIFGEELWIRPPEIAIIHDIKAAKALYKEVMDSDDPTLSEALKANAIYKYAFLFVHGSFLNKEGPVPDSISAEVVECKRKFDVLTNKGDYAMQMDGLSRVTDVPSLVYLSQYHPYEALKNMEDFGTEINKFRDICKECSKNMGIRNKLARFWS